MSERAASRGAHRPRGFLAGVSFLTRIPVRVTIGEADVAASIAWFSVVGALIGVVSGAVYLGARELWPPAIAAVLAVGASVAITGAFHEDGLGDTADAFGAASTGRDPGPVLKDPRMGAFGVVALLGGLGLRAAVLVSAPSVATGLGSTYAGLAARWRGWVACGVGIAVATVCLGAAGPIAAVAAGLAAWAFSSWAARALGGVSGDVLGAIEQVAEGAVLVVVAGVARAGHLPWWR